MYLIQFSKCGLIEEEALFHRVENARSFYVDIVAKRKLVEMKHDKGEYIADPNKMIELYDEIEEDMRNGGEWELRLDELEPMDLPESSNKRPDIVNTKHRPFTKGYKITKPNRQDKNDVENVFQVFECRATKVKVYKLKDGKFFTFLLAVRYTGDTLKDAIDFIQKNY